MTLTKYHKMKILLLYIFFQISVHFKQTVLNKFTRTQMFVSYCRLTAIAKLQPPPKNVFKRFHKFYNIEVDFVDIKYRQ